MGADNPRIQDLRRRIQMNPASIAFAQLAEECRRIGEHEEAIRVSRQGLARYPEYLSARVTLGRALIAVSRLDEAETEFELVLQGAPDNLAAARSLAEIRQQRGEPPLVTPPSLLSATPRASEVLFDLDKLLEQLDERVQKPPGQPQTAAPEERETAPPIEIAASSTTEDTLALDDESLLALEHGLAAYELPVDVDRRNTRTIAELERWLDAIVAERERRSGT